MDATKLASALGVPAEAADQVGLRVAITAFSQKLAEYGIVPETQAEVVELWNHAAALDQLTTQQQNSKQASYVENAMSMIRRAAAGGSAGLTQEKASLAYEVRSKTAGFMEDPSIYASALVDLTRHALPEGGAK